MAGEYLTAEHLREILDYNPITGVFIRRVPGPRIRVGDIAGHVDRKNKCNGYVVIKVHNRGYKGHRLAWLHVYGRWPVDQIDHIDGDRTNNAIANLREANNRLNMENQRRARSDNRLGVLGVRPSKNKFQARIRIGEKLINLGLFSTPEEAHAAYLKAKRKLHRGCTI